ncbi:MAG: 3'-5' exonuclease [Bacteroidota bacterium]
MNYIILDLEATCWEKRDQRPNETIEIGALLINENKEIVSEFCQFIQPKVHPTLSDFCTKLTSIRQEDVEQAGAFPQVITAFQQWFGYGEEEYLLCSWGKYDKHQFQRDCDLHGIDKSWTDQHISLKHQYAEIQSLKRPIGMKAALNREGLSLDGTHHRGIDDARNISKIFLQYYGEWRYL